MAIKINIPQKVDRDTRVIFEQLIKVINAQDDKIIVLEKSIENLTN